MSLVHKSIFFFKLISDLVLGLLFFFSRLISNLGFFFLDLGFFCHVLIISRSRFQSWQSSFCLAPLFYPRLLFFFSFTMDFAPMSAKFTRNNYSTSAFQCKFLLTYYGLPSHVPHPTLVSDFLVAILDFSIANVGMS